MEPNATNADRATWSTWNTFTIARFVIMIFVRDVRFRKVRYSPTKSRVNSINVSSNLLVQAEAIGVIVDTSADLTMTSLMSFANLVTPTFIKETIHRDGNVGHVTLICASSVPRSLHSFPFRRLLKKIVP